MDREKERRKAENQDLIERMRRGESLARIPATATWFQPRPSVKKDGDAMARLYGLSVLRGDAVSVGDDNQEAE